MKTLAAFLLATSQLAIGILGVVLVYKYEYYLVGCVMEFFITIPAFVSIVKFWEKEFNI